MSSRWKSQSRFSGVKTEKGKDKAEGQNKDVGGNKIRMSQVEKDQMETEREDEERHCAKQGYLKRRPSHLQRAE